MGTPRQASTLVKLQREYLRKLNLPPVTKVEEEIFYQKILAAPNRDVQKAFAKINAVTGFNHDTAPATQPQLKRIRQLEVAAYGRATTSWRDNLSFIDASAAIDRLIQVIDELHASVRAVENFANESTSAASKVDQ